MHKRPLTNSKRISDYNKFLSTLDKKNSKEDIPLEEKKIIKSEEEMKEFIDEMIKNLDEDFEKNDLSSSNFTGQTPKDIAIQKPKNCCRPKSAPKYIIKKKEPEVEIKQHINIDAEVNNIDDILKLIDTYKADPSIKYNINIKALHNIKEPLEELRDMVGMNDLKNNILDQILYFVQELHKDHKSKGDESVY